MASNNSTSSNDTLHTNIRVKIEPDTSVASVSASTSSASSVSLSERIANIKMEPGLPITTTATQRLRSYRLPRDLTLGGNVKTEKPKKVYTPNLNVQRNKKKDNPVIPVKTESTKTKTSDRGRGRGRGRGKGDKINIIESVGVWSEGIYAAPTVKKSDSPRISSSTSTIRSSQKPKLDINKFIDKTEEEKRLKDLLIRDDLSENQDTDEKMCPLILPRIKKDTYDVIDNEIDKKPIISENGEIIDEKEEKNQKQELTISQIIDNKANSYTIIQFPECLPGLESNREEVKSKSNETNAHSENDKNKTDRCVLNNLRSGLLGKLEILKSGRTRLRLGEMSFFVDICTQQRFQQDLFAVKIDSTSQTGDLINLGPVNNKLICSPDFENS